jgi:hypothetical protein
MIKEIEPNVIFSDLSRFNDPNIYNWDLNINYDAYLYSTKPYKISHETFFIWNFEWFLWNPRCKLPEITDFEIYIYPDVITCIHLDNINENNPNKNKKCHLLKRMWQITFWYEYRFIMFIFVCLFWKKFSTNFSSDDDNNRKMKQFPLLELLGFIHYINSFKNLFSIKLLLQLNEVINILFVFRKKNLTAVFIF